MPRSKAFKSGFVRTNAPKQANNIFKTGERDFAFSFENATWLGQAAMRSLAGGAAIMFGYSMRTGTLSITIFEGDERNSAYVRTEEELTEAIDAILAYFPDPEQEDHQAALNAFESEVIEQADEGKNTLARLPKRVRNSRAGD